LGQVASQTSTNLHAESIGINFPIYHPLISMDKSEITALARKIGTFEISTSPGGGCKAIPRHPATSAKVEDVSKAEAMLDVPALIAKSLKEEKVNDG
jgi:thiamine biosynthesis protein ThiI